MANLQFTVDAETRAATAKLGAFAQDLQKTLTQAIRKLPDLEITADSSDAQKAVAQLRSEMATLANKRIGIDISAEDALQETQRLQTELRQLAGTTTEVQVSADARAAASALGDVEARMRALRGEEVEVEVTADTGEAEDRISGFKAAAVAGLAAAGAAAGAALSRALSTALDIQEGKQKLEAQFGLTKEAAQNAGDAAGRVFSTGLVDNMESAREGVTAVGRSLVDLGTAGVDDIERISSKALLLADTFGLDVTEAANAAGRMIKAGLVDNADEAFDVLAKGFQNGANASDDLLETLQEYSPILARVGLDGQQALGMLGEAQKAGLRDTDVWADAIKEFSLLVVEVGGTASEAFEELGLNVKQTQKAFGEGGQAATLAMSEVVQALMSVKDPLKQNELGVKLFGTMWEDTVRDILPSFDPMVAGLGDVSGTMDTLNETTTTSTQKVQAMRNQFDLWLASLVDVKGPVGDVAAGLEAFGPMALTAVGAIAPLILALKMGGVASALGGVAAGLGGVGAAGAAAGGAAGAGGLLAVLKKIAVVAGVGAAAVGLDAIAVSAAGGAEKLDYMGEKLHNFVEAGKQLATDPGAAFKDMGSELDQLVRKFETGTSDAGRMWGDFTRMLTGVHVDPINISADATMANDTVRAFVEQIRSFAPTVEINGNANNAVDAYKEVLREIAAGKAEINIGGRTMPALEALEYVKSLINNGVGEVTINGETMPASEALARFMGEVGAKQGKVVVGADITEALAQLNSVQTQIAASKATVTINGNKLPAADALGAVLAQIDAGVATVAINGNQVPAANALASVMAAINAGAGTVTINGNKVPAADALAALVAAISSAQGTATINGNATPAHQALSAWQAQGNSTVATVRAYGDASSAEAALNYAARDRYSTIYTEYGGSRVTAGGGVFGYAGGGLLGFAGGGMHRFRKPNPTSGMVNSGYAPGVDSVPTLTSPGEAVLVPELVRRLGARRILAANAEASGGRKPTLAGNLAGMMDGTIKGYAGGGVVAPRYGEKLTLAQAKAGWFQDEDGSFDNINDPKWDHPGLAAWKKATRSAAIDKAYANQAVGEIDDTPGGGVGGGSTSGPVAVHDDAVKASIEAFRADAAKAATGRQQLAALGALLGALGSWGRSHSGDRCEDSRRRSTWGAW